MIERFAQHGLPYNPPQVIPNTKLALQLSELARDHDLHEPFHHRLMDAYWTQATNVDDPDTLRRLAREVGLPEQEVEKTIAGGDTYLPRVLESTRYAQSIGINGITSFDSGAPGQKLGKSFRGTRDRPNKKPAFAGLFK
jgi:predicted DsbA family dithiol-disulfide isomerase